MFPSADLGVIPHLRWYMDTVFLLVDSESSSVAISPSSEDECNITDATAIHIVQLIMPALYLGNIERVVFLANKFQTLDQEGTRMPMRVIQISFYHGLAIAGIYRRRKNKKLLAILEKAISVLKKASVMSSWNFRGKLLLLHAEKMSIVNMEPNYDIAIKASRASKFIHEEALACELAGKHFERKKNLRKALSLYRQAEKCYIDWGTEKKANQMKEMVTRLSLEEVDVHL